MQNDEDFGIKRIEFIDDIFNVNIKHCTEFLKNNSTKFKI